jgi:FixJ family two-component response regulator
MSARTVFIVDDDPAVRDALCLLLGIEGYRVSVFSNGHDFLHALRPDWTGCVLLDIRMPGLDGLELQQILLDRHPGLPVIIMTGHGDVSTARQAFRAQAVDFLEKPIDREHLMNALHEALHRPASTDEAGRRWRHQLDSLTPREREVVQQVIQGLHNREIAAALGISPRTVEVHKARAMDKLGAASVAELVRLSLGG